METSSREQRAHCLQIDRRSTTYKVDEQDGEYFNATDVIVMDECVQAGTTKIGRLAVN
jgi:hypothetical protein